MQSIITVNIYSIFFFVDLKYLQNKIKKNYLTFDLIGKHNLEKNIYVIYILRKSDILKFIYCSYHFIIK